MNKHCDEICALKSRGEAASAQSSGSFTSVGSLAKRFAYGAGMQHEVAED